MGKQRRRAFELLSPLIVISIRNLFLVILVLLGAS